MTEKDDDFRCGICDRGVHEEDTICVDCEKEPENATVEKNSELK